jgi:hypothetical protein
MLIKLGEGGAVAEQIERGVMATKLEERSYNGKTRRKGADGNKTRKERW